MEINYKLMNSYQECHKIFKQHAKTYYWGALLFNHDRFLHICAFYALVRYVDDIVDTEIGNNKIKFEKILEFEKKFFDLLELTVDKKFEIKEEIWLNYPTIMRAVIYTTNLIKIDRIIYHKFFFSMKLDLKKNKYNTFRELKEYMEGSAAVIGEVMLQIMSFNNNCSNYNDNKMRLYARNLGFGFQLTNFLRDIKEDLLMLPSRVYIPIEDQKKFNCDISEFVNDDNFKKLIEFELKRCDEIYQIAQVGIEKIDSENRDAINISKILYSQINQEIRKKKYDVSERISISKFEKIKILYNTLGFWKAIIVIFTIFFNYLKYNYIYVYVYSTGL
ncbi:Squalene/phytoene synthase [seawater metagenome]|uniref:Squalene/phytoene synthase n=1 Tax=seawater metagenome TaxID=1561972 RepID=A0A5E8CIP0_9ZZZZ